MKKIMICVTLLLILTGQAMAEKRYVTDRILLGIHTEADEASPLIKSIPSGTELEVISKKEGYIQVKLDDGTVGWVSSGFIMENPPASRKYDVLSHQYEETTLELDKLKKEIEKKDRELQVRRDQISNATTTIRELKKRGNNTTTTTTQVVVDQELENKLADSLAEAEVLKQKVAELEEKSKQKIDMDKVQVLENLKKVKIQNDVLQTRIDVALSHLNGDRIPTPEELASISPQFPNWYWGLLVVILLIGIITGLILMDHRFRRRHGGFRI